MTHTHKRPRKILGLKTEIITCAFFGENTFSELQEACFLAQLEVWRMIEEEYKIPCPTCPKPKKKK